MVATLLHMSAYVGLIENLNLMKKVLSSLLDFAQCEAIQAAVELSYCYDHKALLHGRAL